MWVPGQELPGPGWAPGPLLPQAVEPERPERELLVPESARRGPGRVPELQQGPEPELVLQQA